MALLKIERKGLHPVRTEEEHGSAFVLFGLWMAANVEFGTLSTGALSTGVLGLSLPTAFLSICLANVIGAGLLGIFSRFGIETRLPQMVQAKHVFGTVGNRFPAFLNFFTAASFFAMNTVVGAAALESLLPIGLPACVIVLALAQIAIAVVGYDLIQLVEKSVFWVLLLVFAIFGCLVVLHMTMPNASAPIRPLTTNVSGAFILSTATMLSFSLSWVPYASDYSRYVPDTPPGAGTRVMLFTFAGCLISTVCMEGLGSLIGSQIALSRPGDLLLPWLPGWFMRPLVVAIVLGTVMANVVNLYSATLSLLAMGVRLAQSSAALLSGGLGLVVALLSMHSFYTVYENFLFVIAYWTAPWVAVVLVAHLSRRPAGHARIMPGFVAWLIGIAASVPFMDQEIYTGVVARAHPGIGDLSFVVSSVVAVVAYRLLLAPRGAVAA